MSFPEYILENEKWCLRRENRKEFLKKEEKVRYNKKNKTWIVCMFYKSTDNIKILADYINKEKEKEKFDLIIINNSPEIDVDFSKELEIDNVIILSSITNLWTDGWYCLWLEYTIDKGYDYVFLIEDDVVFLDEQAFSDVYQEMNKRSIWFLSKLINYPWEHSCIYQFACYPIDFLKKCWTIDPRFFTRWWEVKWGPKIEETIREYEYKKVIIKKRHFHPYLKKNNRSYRRIYFARRNTLWLTLGVTRPSKKNIITLFMYIRSWYTKLLFGKSGGDLKAIYFAIKDFLFKPEKIDISLARIKQLHKPKTSTSKEEKEVTVNMDKINNYTNGLFILWGPSPSWISMSWFINEDLEYLGWSSKWTAFLRKWMIVTHIESPLYPLAILSKKIVAVDEIDIRNNTAHIVIIKNEKKFRLLRVIVALFLGTITFLIAIILIFTRTIIYRIAKR